MPVARAAAPEAVDNPLKPFTYQYIDPLKPYQLDVQPQVIIKRGVPVFVGPTVNTGTPTMAKNSPNTKSGKDEDVKDTQATEGQTTDTAAQPAEAQTQPTSEQAAEATPAPTADEQPSTATPEAPTAEATPVVPEDHAVVQNVPQAQHPDTVAVVNPDNHISVPDAGKPTYKVVRITNRTEYAYSQYTPGNNPKGGDFFHIVPHDDDQKAYDDDWLRMNVAAGLFTIDS